MAGYNNPQSRGRPWRPQGWTRITLILIVLAIGSYLTWRQQQNERLQPQREDSPAVVTQERPSADTADAPEIPEVIVPDNREVDRAERAPSASPRVVPPTAATTTAARRTTIPNQTIRDLEGAVAFRGEIDVGPTLERIQAGRRLNFPNDGVTFQNRERRLPRKPAGYYKEYVHPTPGIRGPGPQRIVAGEAGEFYYTPDHYRTFRRLEGP